MGASKQVAIGLGLVLLLVSVAFAISELDGKTFDVTVVDTGSGEEQSDTLIFDEGMFESVGCREYGFGKAPYHAEQKETAWSFESETHSEEEGDAMWSGTVKDDAIEGTMEWSKPGQDTIRYTFSGSLTP